MNIKKFDINKLKDNNNAFVIIGKRAVGKSFLIRDILKHNSDIPMGDVVSPSEDSKMFFSSVPADITVHKEITDDLLDEILTKQKKSKSRSFLVLDDSLQQYNRWRSDDKIFNIFSNSRHYNMSTFVTSQNPCFLPPSLRANADYVFIFRDNSIYNKEQLYKNWADMFPNFKTFFFVIDRYTENYKCLVIDNTVKSNKIEDIVFWYKANDRANE